MGVLICHSVGAAVAVQDLGRAGLTGLGISRGGAMDRLALLEATALLGAPREMPSPVRPARPKSCTATAGPTE